MPEKSSENNEMFLLKNEIALLKDQNTKLITQRNQLFIELQKYQGFKSQLRMLFVTLYNWVDNKADKIALPAKYSAPTRTIDTALEYEKLRKQIKEYDRKVLSDRRVLGAYWRRVLSKSIKLLIRIPKKVAIALLNLFRRIRSIFR